jgi:hypothetical protein
MQTAVEHVPFQGCQVSSDLELHYWFKYLSPKLSIMDLELPSFFLAHLTPHALKSKACYILLLVLGRFTLFSPSFPTSLEIAHSKW